MNNDHAKSMKMQATTFKTMLDKQAAANKAMIEAINKSNQENQAEMQALHKQDNEGLKELMATMIRALKVVLAVIMMHTEGNINHVNHHQQQSPSNATTGYEHLPVSNQITPPPHINPNQGQLQQVAYQYLNPSSFVPGFTPPHWTCYTQANKTQ
jgi:hypothetical protein